MITQAKRILSLLHSRTRRGVVGLFFLMLMAAVLETVGISLFLPLLQAMTSPTGFEQSRMMLFVFENFDIENNKNLFVIFCAGFALFFVFKGIALGFLIYIQNKFVTKHQALFSQMLLKRYLDEDYEFHLQHNTMELVRNITLLSVRIFVKGLLPLLQIVMETLVIIGIVTVLVLIEPGSTLAIAGVLGCAVTGFYLIIRNRVLDWGKNTVRLEGEILVWVNQALGSIKETKLYGHELFFTKAFSRPTDDRAIYLAKSTTAPHLPKLFIEAIAIGTMTTLIAVLARDPEISLQSIIPTLGLFAVAAMRLMPSLSKIVSAVTTFRENTAAVDAIYDNVIAIAETEKTASKNAVHVSKKRITFNEELQLSAISYIYPHTSDSLFEDLNLTVQKGKSIAFVGSSGAGKTTLIDLILGLLSPTKGDILVDGLSIKDNKRSWQSLIGYIPQDVYILDDTIRRNVALGMEDREIDEGRLINALTKAQLDDVVDSLPEGLDTNLGEGGSRLSGGQRQRIGIARALYHEPEVLVMDEATSALDGETESKITSSINQLKGDKTILIIAHRLSTVRHCDQIVLMESGRIIDTGTFEELEVRNAQFKRMVSLADSRPEDTSFID